LGAPRGVTESIPMKTAKAKRSAMAITISILTPKKSNTAVPPGVEPNGDKSRACEWYN